MANEIIVCEHCGNRGKLKLCEFCKIAAQRKASDKENEEIYKTSNLVFNCNYCKKGEK